MAAFDRVARNVRHFLEVLDELNHLGIEFVSLRENIVERVKAGMGRARLEGRRIGRAPLCVDRDAILRDRQRGLSLNQIAKAHRISKASVCRLVKELRSIGSQGVEKAVSGCARGKELIESRPAA